MATIDRPPLYTRVPASDPSRALASQPLRGSDLSLLLTAPAAAPQTNRDWANPQLPKFPHDLRTWLNDPLPTLIVVQPATGIAWLEAPDRRWFQAPDIFSNVPLLQPAPVKPTVNSDQPNPAAWYIDRRTELRGFLNFNPLTSPANPGAPLSANFSVNGVNPQLPRFYHAQYGLVAQLSALPLTPPPANIYSSWHGLHLGLRNGL